MRGRVREGLGGASFALCFALFVFFACFGFSAPGRLVAGAIVLTVFLVVGLLGIRSLVFVVALGPIPGSAVGRLIRIFIRVLLIRVFFRLRLRILRPLAGLLRRAVARTRTLFLFRLRFSLGVPRRSALPIRLALCLGIGLGVVLGQKPRQHRRKACRVFGGVQTVKGLRKRLSLKALRVRAAKVRAKRGRIEPFLFGSDVIVRVDDGRSTLVRLRLGQCLEERIPDRRPHRTGEVRLFPFGPDCTREEPLVIALEVVGGARKALLHEALRPGIFKRAKDASRKGVARQTARRLRTARKERTGGRAVDMSLKDFEHRLVDAVGKKRQRNFRRPTFGIELRVDRRTAKAHDESPPDEKLEKRLREAAQRIDFQGSTRVR